jgi:CRP-like cAMP-binding protein
MSDRSAGRNLLLEAISKECGLEKWLEVVHFPPGYEIASPGQLLNYFYFPTSAVLSTMAQLREGAGAETLTIGNEGMVGVPIWLGISASLESVLQQTPGEIIRIPAPVFCKRIIGHRGTERLIKRFIGYSLQSAAQTALCHVHHEVKQRMCRWLLTIADRVNSVRLKLTHALLAQTLGVRRQSVSEVARLLQAAGIVKYRRGEVQILDRPQLEATACECYGEIKSSYDRWVRPILKQG